MAFLTIAVPTFNRAQDLMLLLQSIQSEFPLVQDVDIEVLVVNNASTDETDHIANSFSKSIPGFRYIKNETNVGMAANFIKCLRESTGKYTWMIGDDEFLEPGALRTVMDSIAEYGNKALYLFNYSSEPFPAGDCYLQAVNGQLLATREQSIIDFVFEHGWLWTLGNLGMAVVETAKVTRVDPSPHVGSAFVQAGWYLEALHRESMAFIHKPVFRTRIRSQTVNKERWVADGTYASFHGIINSLDRFVQLDIIEQKVPMMFLNSCSTARVAIWNLFLTPVVERLGAGNFQVDDIEWATMFSLIERVAEPEIREAMSAYLNVLRRSVIATKLSHENSIWLVNRYRPNLAHGIV
jgi:glycosyltransferase involved in cell wall biosynthesis